MVRVRGVPGGFPAVARVMSWVFAMEQELGIKDSWSSRHVSTASNTVNTIVKNARDGHPPLVLHPSPLHHQHFLTERNGCTHSRTKNWADVLAPPRAVLGVTFIIQLYPWQHAHEVNREAFQMLVVRGAAQ